MTMDVGRRIDLSNETIIGRMLHLTDAYAAGSVSANQFGSQMQAHFDALESIRQNHIHGFRDAIQNLLMFPLLLQPEEDWNEQKLKNRGIERLKQFLLELPGGKAAQQSPGAYSSEAADGLTGNAQE